MAVFDSVLAVVLVMARTQLRPKKEGRKEGMNEREGRDEIGREGRERIGREGREGREGR